MPVSGAAIGTTPFGFGTPVEAPLAPTEGPALTRYINPGTGDFEFDSDTGQFKKMPGIRQRVLLIARTLLGSATAAPNLGIRRPAKIDEFFEVRIRHAVREAYSQLTDVERVMRIDTIETQKLSSGRVAVVISYTDLTTIERDSVETIL